MLSQDKFLSNGSRMSRSTSYRNPPPLTDGMSYDTWTKELKIWQAVTDLEPEKQAPAVALTLPGTFREVAVGIPLEKLQGATGMTELLKVMDENFKKESVDTSFEAYREFEAVRGTKSNVIGYIQEFERKYNKIKALKMVYPDEVLGCKMLDNSGLDKLEKQMLLTSVKTLNVDEIKAAMRRIFGSVVGNITDSEVKIKFENEAFAAGKFHRGHPSTNRIYRDRSKSESTSTSDRPAPNKKLNPKNKYGKTTKCAICQSIYHWARDCEHREEENTVFEGSKEESETTEKPKEGFVSFALTTGNKLLEECKNSALLDTGCTHSVCGSNWLDIYVSNLTEEERESIVSRESSGSIVFGDLKKQPTFMEVTFPVSVLGVKGTLTCDVLEGNLPLLLSKEAIKKAKFKIDLETDELKAFNKTLKLKSTSSGHYILPLIERTEQVFHVAHDYRDSKVLAKLHKQFAHCSPEALVKLIRNSGHEVSRQLIEKTLEACQACKSAKRRNPKPVSSLPLATRFNQVISMDLHQLQPGKYYLHIIDLFSRFSVAGILHDKKSTTIIEIFLDRWLSIFGKPSDGIFTDNGGEFNNREFRDLCENLDIKCLTSAAYSPFSNGICERHNGTLSLMLEKVKQEFPTLSDQACLSYCCQAKNSLYNNKGFTPSQIAIGASPSLAPIMDNTLSSLDGVSISQTVSAHISALNSARNEYLKAECSERLRKALKHNVRPSSMVCSGDEVFYKRAIDKKWHGPARVIGTDSSIVFLRHGGSILRIHQSDVQLTDSKNAFSEAVPCNRTENATTESYELTEEDTCDSDDDAPKKARTETVESNENEWTDATHGVTTTDTVSEFKNTGDKRPRRNDIIKFRPMDKNLENEYVAKVLNPAAKRSGAYPNSWNIEYVTPTSLQGQLANIDLKRDVSSWENYEEMTNEVFVTAGEDPKSFESAKQDELNSWKTYGVYREVKISGQPLISTKWITSLRDNGDGTYKSKARLVVRGFEENALENPYKESPVVGRELIKLFLSISTLKRWKIRSIDVKTAFLQGNRLERQLFIKPPREANCSSDTIWELLKPVYGLQDASALWYKRVRSDLVGVGFEPCPYEPALFCYRNEKQELIGIVVLHVDDFLFAGTDEFHSRVMPKVASLYTIGKENECPMKFTGLKIAESEGGFTVSQEDFIKEINIHDVSDIKSDQPLDSAGISILRQLLGQLQWVASQSRPDLSFIANSSAGDLKNADGNRIKTVAKALRKLKFSDQNTIHYRSFPEEPNLCLEIYSDASFQNLADGGSQAGYIIFLTDTISKICHPLCWGSKRVKRVARSTLAAETMALQDALDGGIFISEVWRFLMKESLETVAFVDNKQLYESVYSSKCVLEKRLRVEISAIQEMMKNRELKKLTWVPTNTQLADCLTKKTSEAKNLTNVLKLGKKCA